LTPLCKPSTVTDKVPHSHVHETIQPVIHKETIQPETIHTTVPIHETHYEAAKHHGTSNLPPVSMEQFKSQGGTLSGRESMTSAKCVEGCPQGAHTHSDGSHVSGIGASSSTGSSGMMGQSSTTTTTSSTGTAGTTGLKSTTETKKGPSLMDRLNPMKDADGDGKAGFLS